MRITHDSQLKRVFDLDEDKQHMYLPLSVFLFSFSLLTQIVFSAGLQTFSVGEKLTQLYIPRGWCVLGEREILANHLQQNIDNNVVLAVFVPCNPLTGERLFPANDVWAMWLTQKTPIPPSISRADFLQSLSNQVGQHGAAILGKDEYALYTATKIPGKSDVINAVIAFSKINNRSVTLNIYKTYSSESTLNSLSFAKYMLHSTFQGTKEKTIKNTQQSLLDKVILNGVGWGFLILVFACARWALKRFKKSWKS
ncbi:MAG: hypothetical protein COY40_06825 [Alphaproteobacteria bacterium CG_4_10_14_0_8_um_filter_53_9]|nr:MAG: hypothetical protein COY40_06825 [Alphaproteobacteria bacterium CG_4_10_14_0_8_um_filter_53_9]